MEQKHQAPLNRHRNWRNDFWTEFPFSHLHLADAMAQRTVWPKLADYNQYFVQQRVSNANGVALRTVPYFKRPRGVIQTDYQNFYEPRTFEKGELFAREQDWHDFFNVMVWAHFPRAKAALNERHYRAFCATHPLPIENLKNRTAEQDCLTLFDEGGCVVVIPIDLGASPELLLQQRLDFVLFGHGAYECLYYGENQFSSACVILACTPDEYPQSRAERNAWIDLQLSSWIKEPNTLTQPRQLRGLPWKELSSPINPAYPRAYHTAPANLCR